MLQKVLQKVSVLQKDSSGGWLGFFVEVTRWVFFICNSTKCEI